MQRNIPVHLHRNISAYSALRDTGEVLPVGASGELVFTTITKEGFPVIRYRTRDICSLSLEPCSCGRTHIRMNKPRGRSDDMLIIRGVSSARPPTEIPTICTVPPP